MYCASVNYCFFSYQWLSWNQPGPNSIQWETIQNAFGLYCKFIAHCILSYQWLSWNQPGPNSIQWEFIQISSRYVLRMFQLCSSFLGSLVAGTSKLMCYSVVWRSTEPSVSSPARCERSLAVLMISNWNPSRGEDRAPFPQVVRFSICRASISPAVK